MTSAKQPHPEQGPSKDNKDNHPFKVTIRTLNRPGFDAASFFVKDEAYVEALPGRAT